MYHKLLSLIFSFMFFVPSTGFSADAAEPRDVSEPVDVVDTHDEDIVDVSDVRDVSGVKEVHPPSDVSGALDTIQKAVTHFDKGAWLLFLVATIQVLMFIIKRLKTTKWIAKKHGTAIVMILSGVGTVIATIVSGATIFESIVMFVSSAGTKYFHDVGHKLGIIKHREDKENSDQ